MSPSTSILLISARPQRSLFVLRIICDSKWTGVNFFLLFDSTFPAVEKRRSQMFDVGRTKVESMYAYPCTSGLNLCFLSGCWANDRPSKSEELTSFPVISKDVTYERSSPVKASLFFLCNFTRADSKIGLWIIEAVHVKRCVSSIKNKREFFR